MTNVKPTKTKVTNSVDELNEANCSVYDYLYSKNKDFPDTSALVYYGKSISFSQLFEKIDATARFLKCAGVGKGDIVVVSLPSIPEAVYLFYAINKIGAVFCGMDCRSSSEEIADTIRGVSPKICFVADFHLKEFKNCVKTPVVYIRATESIGGITRFFGAFANFFTGRYFIIRKMQNIFSYRQFVSAEKQLDTIVSESIYGEDVCALFYTSGTTYGRKCVMLTNYNINSAVFQHSKAQVDMQRGDLFSNIMPLFTCYGVTLGTHLPLCLGIRVNLVPLFFGKNMKKLLVNTKSNFIITVPAHWEHFRRDNFKDCDLSFFKAAIVGGDSVEPEYENQIKDILKKCNSKGRFMIGYGLTETASTAVTPPVGTPQGSIGKEMSNTLVSIFSEESGEECAPTETGEICISGPSVCKGYFNDIEATNRLLRIHKDGRVWLHSGDIGYKDSQGYIYFCERIKRMYVRFDGTKVSPYSIEQVISKCPEVERCLVLAVKDKDHSHGKCSKALIVLKETGDKSACEKYIVENLPAYMRPSEVVFTDKLPVTKNGKVDYFGAGE